MGVEEELQKTRMGMPLGVMLSSSGPLAALSLHPQVGGLAGLGRYFNIFKEALIITLQREKGVR